jgi:hypothetical protein
LLKYFNVDGKELLIKVSWAEQLMVAKLGDYLVDAGYSVSNIILKMIMKK